MDNKTKAILIIGGVAVSAVATYFIVKKLKDKKSVTTVSGNKTGSSANDVPDGYDKYGWKIMERAPGAPGNHIATRANNPFDIRSSSVKWDGQIGTTSKTGFCVFESLKMGIRAAFKNLKAYENRGLKTLKGKMSTWAPSTENRATYPDELAAAAGVNVNDPAPISNVEYWVKVMPHWAKLEGYEGTLTATTIREAYKLASI